MVSVLEKIHPEPIDGDDDSDAPLEVTTKTSKVEKRKKKKKNNKRRIKYNLATDDDQNLEQKHVDEESALTHLVFGDDEEYLDELTSANTSDKKVYLQLSGLNTISVPGRDRSNEKSGRRRLEETSMG